VWWTTFRQHSQIQTQTLLPDCAIGTEFLAGELVAQFGVGDDGPEGFGERHVDDAAAEGGERGAEGFVEGGVGVAD